MKRLLAMGAAVCALASGADAMGGQEAGDRAASAHLRMSF